MPRRVRKKKSYLRKGLSALAMASSAVRSVRYLRKVIGNTEYKVHLSSFNGGVASTGADVILSNIPQGDAQQERNGNSIRARFLLMRFFCELNSNATGANMIRIIVYTDLQQVSDTAPAIGALLQSITPLSSLDLSFRGRFRVIRDKLITLDTGKGISQVWKWFIPYDKHIRFNGAAATDIQKGGLYLAMVSNATSNNPTVVVECSLSFIDN